MKSPRLLAIKRNKKRPKGLFLLLRARYDDWKYNRLFKRKPHHPFPVICLETALMLTL